MKLEEILNIVNSFEKNAFLRILDNVISSKPTNYKAIDKILSKLDGHLKNADNQSVTDILALVEGEFAELINQEFTNTTSQLDILIDIIIRDGNSLMKREWLLKLYEKEIKNLKVKLKNFKELIESDNDEPRIQFYRIYKQCLEVAYANDTANNQDNKITKDEQSILNVLTRALELSHEEVKLINYTVIPFKKLDIDEVIKYLCKIGAVLYSRKDYQVYVPDEVVRILRKIRGKEVSDKVFRQVLKQLKDGQINLLARKHNIDRKLSREEKIKEIINEGISFSTAILNGIHKEGTNKNEKRVFLNDLIEKKLQINEHIKGISLESKLENLITYFETKEKDSSISIAVDGYEKLVIDLENYLPKFIKIVKDEYELEESISIDAKTLLSYNIRPQDLLYIFEENILKGFCEKNGISIRGNEVLNILEKYKDSENLYIENYPHIAARDLNALKENGLSVKDTDLGIKFEDVTKSILMKLGFNVDENLKKRICDSKNKIDIVISLTDNELMIIECKSKKDISFKSYSSVARQVKAYKDLAQKKEFKIVKTFIVAPEFSDDFIKECGLDYELNLSLITAKTLFNIYNAFKESKLKVFPYSLLLRDVLINEERVIKSIGK